MMMMMMINKIKAETETGQPCDLTLWLDDDYVGFEVFTAVVMKSPEDDTLDDDDDDDDDDVTWYRHSR
jgi:hypothetical protein